MLSSRTLRGMDVEACLGDASRKQAFVTPMFDIIAPRYDSFTRLFSFGMDAHWKRRWWTNSHLCAARTPSPSTWRVARAIWPLPSRRFSVKAVA